MTENDVTTEEWRPVPIAEYAEAYSVSNLGNTRREIARTSGKVGRPAPSQINCYGYVLLRLCNKGKHHTVTLHRLVAIAFLGPIPAGHTVDHINGIKADNRASNLRYLTGPEQMREASRLGLLAKGNGHYSRMRPDRVPRGSKHGKAQITEDTAAAIRVLRSLGWHYAALTRAFGISKDLVAQVATGKTWKHVTGLSSE